VTELEVFGVDLTPKVTKWGTLEEVKNIQLGQGTLFTSEIEVELENVSGAFSPGPGASSLAVGSDWYGKPLTITRDDERNTSVVDEYAFTNYSVETFWRFNNNNQGVGQTVTPPARPFDLVDVELRKIGSPVGYVWAEWQGVSGGLPDGVIHAVSNRARAERLGNGLHDVQRFRFPQPIHPDGVTQYSLLIMSDVPVNTTNYLRLGRDATAPSYAGGAFLNLSNGVWSSFPGSDAIFELRAFEHITLFAGTIKDIIIDTRKKTAKMKAENIFKSLAETLFVGNGTAVNPGAALLSIASTALDDDLIDAESFTRAGQLARANSATITYRYEEGEKTTVMEILETIANLTSIIVYVHNNKLFAQAFQAYRGDESGLRFEIGDSLVRKWGKHKHDTNAFNNIVTVGYTVDDTVTRTDTESIRRNDIEREMQFDGSENLVANGVESAIWFGDQYLARAAQNRGMLMLSGGRKLSQVRLGERFPITQADMGLSRSPMEVIQVNRQLTTEDVDLTLVELVAQ